MTIIQLIVLILVVGMILWLINMLPIDTVFKRIAMGLLILVVIIWLLSVVGLLPGGRVIG